jgi:two-component system CheB/CheR fusion protein
MNDTVAQSIPAPPVASPIVGLGASAGGLAALQQLFAELPADTGMAYVVIQHMDPDQPSMLARLLESRVRMPVVEVTDGMMAAPNRIHVIPPGSVMGIHDGVLSLKTRSRARGLHLPIDTFFQALADDRRGCAIGVVLSGTGTDGTDGLRAIKAAGGIAFVQEPSTAEFRGMPTSAIAAGVVDVSAPPSELARELIRIGHHPYLLKALDAAGGDEVGEGDDDEEPLDAVLAAVRGHGGLDFRGYKRATIARRIARRMALRHVASTKAYA